MKALLAAIFLSKVILLTPQSIDISNNWHTVQLKKPVVAVDSGASLMIEIVLSEERLNVVKPHGSVFKRLAQMFPRGTFQAKLVNDEGDVVFFKDHSYSVNNFRLSEGDLVRAVLKSTDSAGTPVGVEYDRVKVRSGINIDSVMVYWENYGK